MSPHWFYCQVTVILADYDGISAIEAMSLNLVLVRIQILYLPIACTKAKTTKKVVSYLSFSLDIDVSYSQI